MNLIGCQYGKYRLAVEAWGLKNCTQEEEWFSDTVTAVVVPPYIDGAEIVRRAWKRYNLSLGLGLNKVAGKVFRIGHLGNLNEVTLIPQTFNSYVALLLEIGAASSVRHRYIYLTSITSFLSNYVSVLYQGFIAY